MRTHRVASRRQSLWVSIAMLASSCSALRITYKEGHAAPKLNEEIPILDHSRRATLKDSAYVFSFSSSLGLDGPQFVIDNGRAKLEEDRGEDFFSYVFARTMQFLEGSQAEPRLNELGKSLRYLPEPAQHADSEKSELRADIISSPSWITIHGLDFRIGNIEHRHGLDDRIGNLEHRSEAQLRILVELDAFGDTKNNMMVGNVGISIQTIEGENIPISTNAYETLNEWGKVAAREWWRKHKVSED